MTTETIQILDPRTGKVLRHCRGPTAAGTCPLAGPDGVVPCAGSMIAPLHGDAQYWPLHVPPDYRHCDVPWNERALSCLRKADDCRRRWDEGLDREIWRVKTLAAARDPRYRNMTSAELRATARWRWRLSAAGQALRKSEQNSRARAEQYLDLVRFRRRTGSVSEWHVQDGACRTP
ncbi:hypothetical protein [Actinoplanes sp. NPDC049599]|uniref:hypothetical protein n=1 Tax=Actinoplanes sp. NPDC049599 TaxID=3363903 RepID=UPI0037970242